MSIPQTQLIILSYHEWEAIEHTYAMMLRMGAYHQLKWQAQVKQQLGIDQPSWDEQLEALKDRYPVNSELASHRASTDRWRESNIIMQYTDDQLRSFLVGLHCEKGYYKRNASADWPEYRNIVRRLKRARRELRFAQARRAWCKLRRLPEPQRNYAW